MTHADRGAIGGMFEEQENLVPRSTWLIAILIVVVVAFLAYTRTHPAGLPNFHW